MKTYIKKEKKKYPYHRNKHSIFAQIHSYNQRIKDKLPNYAIIDDKGNIIEKYRLSTTAINEIKKLQKDYYVKLSVVKLNSEGKPGVTIKE